MLCSNSVRDAGNSISSSSPQNFSFSKEAQLITKVKRQNKIMIEFKGSVTISRTD